MSVLNLPSAPNHAPSNKPHGAPRQLNRPNPPGTSKRAQKRTLHNGKAYTSKLRSTTPLYKDIDSTRICDRLATGGTAAELVEEGYRVCRLNASLRRDLDAARQDLRSSMSDDKDSARIKNRLDSGATTTEIAEEAYRICRVNAYRKKNKDGAQGELRFGKKKEAVMEDALQEIRAELPELRKVLERTWGLLESRKVKIPEDLSVAYNALMARDGHDWQARKGMKEDVRLTKKGKKQQGKKSKTPSVEAKDKRLDELEKVAFLLHTQQGKTYDMREPGQDGDDEDGDGDEDETKDEDKDPASPIDEVGGEVEMTPSLAGPSIGEPVATSQDGDTITPNTLTAGVKRKNNYTTDGEFKKAKTTMTADHSKDEGEASTLESSLEPHTSTDRAKEAIEDVKHKATEDMGAVLKKTKDNPMDNDTEDTAKAPMHHPNNKPAITTPITGKNSSTKANPFSTLKRKPTADIGTASKKVKIISSDLSPSQPNFWNSKINLSAHET
jgi:hypothetical protein